MVSSTITARTRSRSAAEPARAVQFHADPALEDLGVGTWGLVPEVGVDGPSWAGDADRQRGERDRDRLIPLRRLAGVIKLQLAFDLRNQCRQLGVPCEAPDMDLVGQAE